MSKETISPSEVVLMMNGGPPISPNLFEAERGRKMHKQIDTDVQNGHPPELLARYGVNESCVGRSVNTARLDIGNGYILSAISDLRLPNKIVEIKPGNSIRGNHLLQLGLTCVASNVNLGAVYLYDGNKLIEVTEGIVESRKNLIDLATNAKIILDIQEEFTNRPSLNGAAKFAMGEKSVRLRQKMDVDYEIYMETIKKRIITL